MRILKKAPIRTSCQPRQFRWSKISKRHEWIASVNSRTRFLTWRSSIEGSAWRRISCPIWWKWTKSKMLGLHRSKRRGWGFATSNSRKNDHLFIPSTKTQTDRYVLKIAIRNGHRYFDIFTILTFKIKTYRTLIYNIFECSSQRKARKPMTNSIVAI